MRWLALGALGWSGCMAIVVPKEHVHVTPVDVSVTDWRASGIPGRCSRRMFEVRDVTSVREAELEVQVSDEPYTGVLYMLLTPILLPISLALTSASLAGETPRAKRIAEAVRYEHTPCASVGISTPPPAPGMTEREKCLAARSAAMLEAQQITDLKERGRALLARPTCPAAP
ncbi:MAG TPA: hypothetical protein VLB44_05630 [Kofleriaceae bacterium]|nr:hypothetical protein [Kofleriaceae bacterium]